MTTSQKPDALDAIRAMCTGSIEWRVARDDGAYCMSFSRDDSHNPEQEANEWLATHLCDYPERFMGYKVQRVVVQSRLQEEALALITRLSDAQASLLAKEAECEALREDAARTERNRDMWKGQCERQAESLTNLRGQRDMFVRLLRECLGPLEVSAAIFESDDAEPLEALIAKATNALAAIDSARAAADQGGAS